MIPSSDKLFWSLLLEIRLTLLTTDRFRNRISADKKRMTPAKFDKIWSNISLVNFNRHGEAEHPLFSIKH